MGTTYRVSIYQHRVLVNRLPTVAASQALDEWKDDTTSMMATGLEKLDKALAASSSAEPEAAESVSHGGIKRGQVTELWGPPGAGKTALAIQMAANTMCDGHGVVWVDCFQKVDKKRLAKVLEAVEASRRHDADGSSPTVDRTNHFTHYSCLTLAHLVALISRPAQTLVGRGVSLVVVSSASALLNSTLPKSQDGESRFKASRGPGPTASAKRLQGVRRVMNALQRLAATRHCAVVVLSQCATRMQADDGPTLVAAVNAAVWEQAISTRLVLFRDWAWQGRRLAGVFLVGFQKLDGKATHEAVEGVSAFKVDSLGGGGGQAGAASIEHDAAGSVARSAEAGRPKRKLGQTELEVADSQEDEGSDEDYGWADEDEAALPAPPPQWQGSEDILLGDELGRSDDEGESAGSAAPLSEAGDDG
ncbi:hypothetical protein RJ55_06280 [Drechmeria coniospora]|nr:hypothetical protein RJ55_06280 [Drechmeria coniospora]